MGSMTTANELKFLQRYARDFYSGKGKIVDLGTWLGATTEALAEGLSESPHSGCGKVLEAYDLFYWDEWMNPIKEAIEAKVDFRNGECFHAHVERSLAQYATWVTVYKADLSTYSPPNDWQIEFLFVDAMKNWELARSIASNFFSKLLPNASLVVQQDFAFYDPIVATNHLLMWHLRSFFEPLHHVRDSCSMVFITKQTPPLSEIPAYANDYFTEDEVQEAYRYCLPMVQESMRPSLLVAKLCHGLMCHQRKTVVDAAVALQTRALSQGMKDAIQRSMATGYARAPGGWDAFVTDMKLRFPDFFSA